ncbi:MAG: hydrogenase expression/formation protein HypE [Nitrospirae bacterium]|nr:hydrogenase expression/formation protein HypE [Nitrospirota bacterium]
MKETKKILLAHGSGGKLSEELTREVFLREFGNEVLSGLTDAAILKFEGGSLAFTTDSYVVNPLFFPGGDIGKLSVCGTVNDLAVMGAKPLFITCGFIIEEGLDYSVLRKIVASMRAAAETAGVTIVAGDTKVVEKGSADGLFINTAGIGRVGKEVDLSLKNISIGDKVLLSGTIGDHGMAVLGKRKSLDFHTEITSDCAPLHDLIASVLKVSRKIKFMRDPTRGGLAATLNEMVRESEWGILVEEAKVPVSEGVKSLAELLGFDSLYIANEGKVVLVVAPEDAERVIEEMRRHALGKDSQVIGEIIAAPKGQVGLKTLVGGTRIVDMPVGEQLPRIC